MSADEYTPTTDYVREAYANSEWVPYESTYSDHLAAFDRWLVEHDRALVEQIAAAIEAEVTTKAAYIHETFRNNALADAARIAREAVR